MGSYKDIPDLFEKNPKAYKQLYDKEKHNKFYSSMSDYNKEFPDLPIYLENERTNIKAVLGGPIGVKLKGTILEVSKDTILLGFNDGQEGRLERRNFAWGMETESLMNLCNVGDELRVVNITYVDPLDDGRGGGELILGRKQLYESPWISFKNKYKVGSKIKVAITAIKKSKLLVTVEELCIKESDSYTVLAGEINLTESIRRRLRSDLKEGLAINAVITKMDVEEEILILQSDEILK